LKGDFTVRIASRLLAVASFVLLLLPVTPAAAAQTLPILNPMNTGTLVGTSGGAFNKYVLQYPGGDQSVTITMDYSPWSPNWNYGIGFQVYDPSGTLIGEGAPVSGQPMELSMTFAADTPGNYTVAVQDYFPGFSMNYTLQVQGLQPASATSSLGSALTPVAHIQALPSLNNQARSGVLGGNPAGAFDKYVLQYPGGDQPVTITMNFSPYTPDWGYGIGFQVYDPNGQLVGEGSPVSGQPMELSMTLTSDTAGNYVVAVQNYYFDFTINYSLQVQG
jgi:hypothetical protein